jgi:hypothetical protein
MEKEFWKNIPRYANQYQASTFGRIRRHPRMVDNNGTLCLKKGAIVTQSINARGLFRVRLFYGGKMREELVHRLVAETFIPNKANQPSLGIRMESSPTIIFPTSLGAPDLVYIPPVARSLRH